MFLGVRFHTSLRLSLEGGYRVYVVYLHALGGASRRIWAE